MAALDTSRPTSDRTPETAAPRPLIVGIGGTMRDNSTTEIALREALAAAERAGATTEYFGAADLDFPLYGAELDHHTTRVRDFVERVRIADGVMIATPGYHGGYSGLVKNALDYLEELRDDSRPYLDGRAVGCITCAYGWQAAVGTLSSLRTVVHALRGWPTPLGVAINSANGAFAQGAIVDPGLLAQLDLLGQQVVEFARIRIPAA
jgi:FMN reductase